MLNSPFLTCLMCRDWNLVCPMCSFQHTTIKLWNLHKVGIFYVFSINYSPVVYWNKSLAERFMKFLPARPFERVNTSNCFISFDLVFLFLSPRNYSSFSRKIRQIICAMVQGCMLRTEWLELRYHETAILRRVAVP